MSQDDDTERSYDPTPKKLEEARKKGEIARSTDVQVAISYLGLCLGSAASLFWGADGSGLAMRYMLEHSDTVSNLVFLSHPRSVLGGWAWAVLAPFSLVFAVPAVLVLVWLIVQRGLVFVPSKLLFKSQRINPIQNAKNKYGRSGLFEFSKSFVKLTVFSLALGFFIKVNLSDLLGLAYADPRIYFPGLLRICMKFFFWVIVIALAIGVMDFWWQHHEHKRKNMMSRKEITDETKEAEGDPYIKQQRRQRAQQVALNQMMADVPMADVVIVNPTHYAVALKWSKTKSEAPVCVAKGTDEIALQIREVAQESAVPIHIDPPCARDLFATVDIGQEIHPTHYRAVAAAIRFAEAVRKKAWK